jgi:hypothetical protein
MILTRTPAFAIAWQLWRRHRYGAIASLATLIAMIATYPWIISPDCSQSFVIVSVFPSFGVIGFFLNALLYVEDVGSMTSGYPRRTFTLPVRTRTLVFWPMLYASSVAALLWVAIAGLVYRRSGFEIPVLWPALGMGVTMAWLQAFSWMPFRFGWVGVVAAVLGIGALGGLAFWLFVAREVPASAFAALLAVYMVAAYATAVAALASDRRGDTWRLWPGWLRFSMGPDLARRARRPFRSPAEAQFWYEWRCHGLGLPVAVAGFLLFYLALGLYTARGAGSGGYSAFATTALFLPVFMACSVGGATTRLAPAWVRDRDPIRFVAIRPMASGGLVAAKFRMATWSVLLAWAVSLVPVLLLVVAARLGGSSEDPWQALTTRYPGWRADAIVALGAVVLPALAWAQMTGFFPIGLTGRKWIETAIAFAFTGLLMAFGAVVVWLPTHPDDQPRVLAAVPWLVGADVALKAVVAAWAYPVALRRGLIRGRQVVNILAAWVVMTSCAVGFAALLIPDWLPVSKPVVLLGVAAFVPLTRFALAPLALDWNRHR